MKKTARNDITGAWIVSKPNNEMFEKNWDLIFGKKKEPPHLNVEEHIIAIIPPMTDTSVTHDELIAKELSRIDVIGQNGNEGIHYEYELNKSTGEVQKKED